TAEPQKPVVDDGKLSPLYLDGTQLCDEAGPIQLRGISTHGLAWFPQYVNEECFKMFKEEWNANVIRLAMYTAENGGYCTDGNKTDLKQLVKDGVAYATNVGLYVIIDWHVLNDRNPNTYKEEALAFFEEMSADYKDYTNVIYEVCNEPNGGVSWGEIKSYAEEVIEVIRKNDEDAIIIVGTPNWSQYVDQAAANPITASDNIMYALHFYAATHKDDLRTQMKNAVNNGLPIFVSEYGICDASGNGGIDEGQANAWVEAMDDLGVSYIAWNLSNKNETSAVIKSSCNKTSGFTKEDLSASGKWLYELLTGKSADDFTPSNTNGQGNAQNQQSSNTGQTPPAPTKAPVANVSTGEGLEISAEVKDSWGGDGGTSYNYSLTITNNSGKAIDGWEITLQFTDKITAVQGWSGNFTIDGNSLRISNVDYNGSIAAGESKQDIGFIVTGSDNMKIK
ncbi:MAG: cellulase family glycosylhydrolase, partial [Lachnospiraceae bacterium]|nr:cellulase family glycosylhydrolase [Lachnospiraceae bacterium]